MGDRGEAVWRWLGRSAPVAVGAAGALTALAFPEPNVFPLAWVGIAPLIAGARAASARRGLALGLMWGLGFFGVLIYWISIVGFLAWIVLVLLQSCFVGAFGAAWAFVSRSTLHRAVVIIAPAVLWVAVVEFLRGNVPFGGFTWGQLAQSQTSLPPMMRLASVTGSWGIAFVLITVNLLLVLVVRRLLSGAGPRATFLPAGVVLMALLLPLAVPAPRVGAETLRVAIVQGNIPRAMAPSVEKDLVILGNHRRLTEELRDVDLVVWPESSLGLDPRRVTDAGLQVADAARGSGSPLLIGGDLERDDGRRQVMAYLVSREGEIVDEYQKTHLVPFGEYVPARWLFGGIPAVRQVPRDAVPGIEPALFNIAGVPVAPVISFEGDFGSLVRDRIARGGRVLVVATNTSTWDDSWASAQHLAMTRLRAAENAVPVVHAALTGISAFIAPDGRVHQRSEMWSPIVLERDVSIPTSISVYAYWGDGVAWLSALFTVVLLAGAAFRRRRRGSV